MQRPSPSLLLAAVCTLAACSGTQQPHPDTCSNVPASALVDAWPADPHYCLIQYADGLAGARQLAVAPNGDLFVMASSQIVALLDTNGDGVSDAGERTMFAGAPGANHGLAITPTHVYASSS